MKLRIPYFDVSKVSETSINTRGNKRVNSLTSVFKTGRALGSGQFGTVYTATGNDASIILDHIDTYYRGEWHKVAGKSTVVVKIMKSPEERNKVQTWLKNALRELYIQHHLSSAPKKVIKGKTFDVKKYVPTPYFGGYVRSTREFVIVMKMQPGKTLENSQYLRNKNHYLSIERAYISMLLNNVLHLDFHAGNIMVTDDGSIHLIDFGGAVLLSDVLPSAELKSFKRRLYVFVKMWPEITTYATQAKNINHTILKNINLSLALENQLNLWPQSASDTLTEMRGFISRRNNIKELASRKLPGNKIWDKRKNG